MDYNERYQFAKYSLQKMFEKDTKCEKYQNIVKAKSYDSLL
jgi:hypothetical protein